MVAVVVLFLVGVFLVAHFLVSFSFRYQKYVWVTRYSAFQTLYISPVKYANVTDIM